MKITKYTKIALCMCLSIGMVYAQTETIENKSPVGYYDPNYLFTYTSSPEYGSEDSASTTMVLVKNYIPVSAVLLFDQSSIYDGKNVFKKIPRFIALSEASYLPMVMDIINGKKCQEARDSSFDAGHFPIKIDGCGIYYDSKSKTCEYSGKPGYATSPEPGYIVEPTYCGSANLNYTHHEKVDANYTINLQLERFKELERNYKKWKAQHIKLYSLSDLSGYHECIKEIVKNETHIKTVKRCRHRKKNRFLTIDNIFAFVKEKLFANVCMVAVDYSIKYGYPKTFIETCENNEKKEIFFRIKMESIDLSDNSYLNPSNLSSWDLLPHAVIKVESKLGRKDIVFSWQDESDNEEGFKLYVNNKLLTTVGRNINEFKIKVVTLKRFIQQNKYNPIDKATTYKLEVKAYNKAGEYTSDDSYIEFILEK